MERKPILIWITRSTDQMLDSYRRRGAPGDVLFRIRQGLELCRRQYEFWPWAKVTVEYERLAAAVQLFDPQRAARGQQRRSQAALPSSSGQPGAAQFGIAADSGQNVDRDSRFGVEQDSNFGVNQDSGFGTQLGSDFDADSVMDVLSKSLDQMGLSRTQLMELLKSESSLDSTQNEARCNDE